MAKWQELEEIIERISVQLSPNSRVRRNVYLKDRTGIDEREFDVLIEVPAPFKNQLVAIECKDYKRSVSVDKVESFRTKLEDCQINQGIMIARKGFTEGSQRKAGHYNILLLSYRQAEMAEWEKLVGPESWFRFVREAFIPECIGVKSSTGDRIGIKFDAAIYSPDGHQLCPAIDLAHQLIHCHPYMSDPSVARRERQLGQQWLSSRPTFPDGPLSLKRYGERIEIDEVVVNGRLIAHAYSINLAFGDGSILQDVLSGQDKIRSLHSAPFRIHDLLRTQAGVELSPEEYALSGQLSFFVPPEAMTEGAQMRISFVASESGQGQT